MVHYKLTGGCLGMPSGISLFCRWGPEEPARRDREPSERPNQSETDRRGLINFAHKPIISTRIDRVLTIGRQGVPMHREAPAA